MINWGNINSVERHYIFINDLQVHIPINQANKAVSWLNFTTWMEYADRKMTDDFGEEQLNQYWKGERWSKNKGLHWN